MITILRYEPEDFRIPPLAFGPSPLHALESIGLAHAAEAYSAALFFRLTEKYDPYKEASEGPPKVDPEPER